MAKVTGLGWTTMSVADSGSVSRAIINGVTNLKISTPRAVQDVTGIDKSAFERLLLLADLSLDLNGVFDDTASIGAHAVFSTVPSTSVARAFTITVDGKTLGTTNSPTLLPTDYQLTRTTSGELNWQVPLVLANGAIPAWS